MTQLITTNDQQHVSKVSNDVGITLHLSPNVTTLKSLLHLRAVITFRSSITIFVLEIKRVENYPDFEKLANVIAHLHDDVTRAKNSGSCSQIRGMF